MWSYFRVKCNLQLFGYDVHRHSFKGFVFNTVFPLFKVQTINFVFCRKIETINLHRAFLIFFYLNIFFDRTLVDQ